MINTLGLTPGIWLIFLVVLLGTLLPQKIGGNPVKKESSDLVKHWEPVRSYLDQYGYLSTSPLGADNLRTEEKLREAIMRMQRFGGVAPTGIIDEETLKLLKRKRCGMPDLTPSERVRRYAVQGQQWSKKDLTWSIKYWPQSLSADLVKAELKKAFKVWSDVSLLTFREVKTLDADIVVSFERGQHGDGYAFDGRGVVLAHAFFPGEGIGGDAHFDAEEPWVDRQPSAGIDGVRLFAVAAHEFGHSLGLSHSSVSGALMNPFYQVIQDNFQLPHDDTVGIQMLYGARNPTKWVPLSPYIPPKTSTPTQRPVPGNPGVTYPVDRPKPHHPKHPPSTCNTTFDAISVIRREIFIFKNNFFWRLNSQGLMKDYPVKIERFWQEPELQHIDAVYERPVDTKIVFFSGNKFWLFNGNRKEYGYPRPLTDLGLPPDLKKIDAAFVWGYNGKTYLFSGTQYWRYDESEGRVELDYPRDMAMWRGVPYHIDAAFQHTDGHTYFFKGRKFWEFNDKQMTVKKGKHNDVNQYWFGCPSRSEQHPELGEEGSKEAVTTDNSSVSCLKSDFCTLVTILVTLFLYKTRLNLFL